ncbi:tubulin-specific chaperone D-like [Liolophura sinensis]|uniref:tubulin-specific chaperone D-like n=1 Tax=Liolophura sinensis TaxID=3198878 RepID=UPI0031591915
MGVGSGDADTKMGDSEDGCGKGSTHEDFKELDELRALVSGLQNVYKDQIALEMSCERMTFIVDQYQEQPHLIDPHLDVLISDILSLAWNPKSPAKVMHESFRYLYLITKVRGYKIVVRHLPHEVADLEPVLQMLTNQDPYDFGTWETRYMLLLWMSMVCMIPFDMSRLDSHAKSNAGEVKEPIMDRIINIGKLYLPVADKSQDAAAYMLSHFLTRPDVKSQRLEETLDWALVTLSKADYTTMQGMTHASGILRMLALLFKQGKREDLLSSAPTILHAIDECKLMISTSTVLTKLSVKLVQRLGLIFLKYRVAAWRYQRGSRSLAENLKSLNPASQILMSNGSGGMADDGEEEYDIPDEIEDVIEQLLIGLKNYDTVVRWSAAKGIGRITGRLPKELADDVVGSVLELFTLQESDGAWHGGCLALAELGRRGLLLPDRLSDVVPVVLRALAYDERKGNFSVGAHVRDAACYVCWAFARAYDPKEITHHVKSIANALVTVSIFDREINVRRAAAAAFQENVGRQGTFPHGIDILTTADYFAVGNRTTCYLNLSVFVAHFEEYTTFLIDHLVNVKISHWDSDIRELSALALHKLTSTATDYMANEIVPALLPKTTGLDLFLRHGSILAVAEIVHALAKIAADKGEPVTKLLDTKTVSGLKDIAKTLYDGKLFRGLGGELMRKAVSSLIEKLSLSKMPYHKDPVIDLWQELIDDCLAHREPEIRTAAASAISAFFTEYYTQAGGGADPAKQEKIIEKYLMQLRSTVETTRRGYALAIGALPKFMLEGKLKPVLASLIQTATVTVKQEKWAESRRDALKAITSVSCTVDVDPEGSGNHVLNTDNVADIYQIFITVMSDYTLDSRGDVGAWVREAAMTGFQTLTSRLAQSHPALLQPSVIKAIFCNLVQQACEKIDRTRAHAGGVFSTLLHHSPPVPHIPHREELEKLFPSEKVAFMNWAAPAETFPSFTRLLALDTYMYHVLLGLIVSVGGMTESLVKTSSQALFEYLRTVAKDKQKLMIFSDTLLQVFVDYKDSDRVAVPAFKMFDQLFSRGCFDLFIEDPYDSFGENLLKCSKEVIFKSGNPQKLMASADVFCGLLPLNEDIRKKALFQLMVFLCHRFPRVRKTTASKLYEAFITYDEVVPEEHNEEVLTILSETNWDESYEVLRPIRNRLCDILNIPKPAIKFAVYSVMCGPSYMMCQCQFAVCSAMCGPSYMMCQFAVCSVMCGPSYMMCQFAVCSVMCGPSCMMCQFAVCSAMFGSFPHVSCVDPPAWCVSLLSAVSCVDPPAWCVSVSLLSAVPCVDPSHMMCQCQFAVCSAMCGPSYVMCQCLFAVCSVMCGPSCMVCQCEFAVCSVMCGPSYMMCQCQFAVCSAMFGSSCMVCQCQFAVCSVMCGPSYMMCQCQFAVCSAMFGSSCMVCQCQFAVCSVMCGPSYMMCQFAVCNVMCGPSYMIVMCGPSYVMCQCEFAVCIVMCGPSCMVCQYGPAMSISQFSRDSDSFRNIMNQESQ